MAFLGQKQKIMLYLKLFTSLLDKQRKYSCISNSLIVFTSDFHNPLNWIVGGIDMEKYRHDTLHKDSFHWI